MQNEVVSLNDSHQDLLADQLEDFPIPNWPGYDYPLACRLIKEGDAQYLYPVMKRSAKSLNGYIGWAKYAPEWDFKTVASFVNDHVKDELPRWHLIFTIGKQVVGFGSLAPMPHSRDVQVSLWVGLGHEGRGIGKWIVTVLEWYAFYVFGYDNLYYQHDATNRKSGMLPRRLGFTYSHSFETEKTAMKESGFWFSWIKERPEGLPLGIIDTGEWEKWSEITFPWKSLIYFS
jgi:RimJ/RimL family protein N-acetyltransferase